MFKNLFTIFMAVIFTSLNAVPQETISKLKFYKVKPGDELGSILVKVRSREVRKKKLYGKDSLVEKVISLKPNEKLQKREGNLIFPGDIIYFTDEGNIDSIQSASDAKANSAEGENIPKPGAQEATAVEPVVPVNDEPSALSKVWAKFELGRFAFDLGGSSFRVDGVNRSNSSDGMLLSESNVNAVLSWMPEIKENLRSRFFYDYQAFTLQAEVNGREITAESENMAAYGLELYYDFNPDFNIMLGYGQTQSILYRGLTVNSYYVDRVSLGNIIAGAGYRVWNTESFDLFLNGIYGSYSPKTEGVYDISRGTKYNLNLALTPSRNLSHGFRAHLLFGYQNLTAEVASRQLDYTKTEIGASVGYFINFSTFEGLN